MLERLLRVKLRGGLNRILLRLDDQPAVVAGAPNKFGDRRKIKIALDWKSKDSLPYSRIEGDIVLARPTQDTVTHILQMNVHDPVSEALDHLTVIGVRRACVARIQKDSDLVTSGGKECGDLIRVLNQHFQMIVVGQFHASAANSLGEFVHF